MGSLRPQQMRVDATEVDSLGPFLALCQVFAGLTPEHEVRCCKVEGVPTSGMLGGAVV